MRLSEDLPLDPEVLAELEAIDATLRGEAVDPSHAELAELALLLADQREPMPEGSARSLDAAVARRFETPPTPAAAGAGDHGPVSPSRRPRLTRWALRPSSGAALAGLAAAAVAGVIVLNNNNPGNPAAYRALSTTASQPSAPASTATGTPVPASPPAPVASPPSGSSGSHADGLTAGSSKHAPAITTTPPGLGPATGVPRAAAGQNSTASGAATQSFGAAGSSAGTAAIVPTPPGNGRRTIQGAQLQLSTPGGKINAVSQELFNVVGFNNGIVKSSQITAGGANSYATFQLSIPSANLAQTMSALSTLRYAHVVARTDATQDVNGQYNAAVHRVADAQALRTALLKQLAAATTETQIASLQAQIKNAEAAIAAAQKALGLLEHQINYSAVQVQINAVPIEPLVASHGSSHGFTLGTAWHDAIRVLTVVAGVSLIALAVLIPLGLVAALIAWIAYWVRRRRREAALDAA
jgi:hypothetical protein